MKTLPYRRALLSAIALLAGSNCGGRAGEQLVSEDSIGGMGGASCEAGVTRECVGPGACRGGQQCSGDGYWGLCVCAATGGSGATGGSTEASSVGGANTGGATTGGANTGGASSAGGRMGQGGASGGVAGTAIAGGRTNSGGTLVVTGGGSGGHGYAGLPTGGNFPTGGRYPTGGSYPIGGDASAGFSQGGSATGGAANRPPKISDLGFSSLSVRTDDVLIVYPRASDPDLDLISFSYAWTRNGTPVGWSTSQLSGSVYFSKGDELKVTVTPSDGKLTGDPVTSLAIKVENSPPQVTTFSYVAPETFADEETSLTCVAAVSDPDGDPIAYGYDWFLNDALATQHDSILPPNATAVGEQWSCQVSASDGSSTVDAGRSGTTVIANLANGIYRADTTWLASKSPYYVTGRIQIAPLVTLKVEPGVRVIGNGNPLESWGNITMLGTKDKPIRVETLFIYDNSTAAAPGKVNLSYVEFVEGSLLSVSSGAQTTVSDCVFRYIADPIVLAAGVSTAHRFERNLFFASCGINSNGPLVLISNTFSFNNSYCNAVNAQDSLVGNLNTFLPETNTMVTLGPNSADLRNNYWGGLADADVSGRITDNNDDLNILGVAEYLPTRAAAHPDAPTVDKTYFP